jgi:ubiquinone/menaquinone biosynthesis C-methylase UbiE
MVFSNFTNTFMETNKKTYSAQKVIDHYAGYVILQKPEKIIFDMLRPDLAEMKMLDLGVGAGRTTAFFAPAVKTYTGIDFIDSMIQLCIKKFQGKYPHAHFMTGDVRTCLAGFSGNSFDFVLFSFNGIDHLVNSERELVFREIKGICSPGGVFCFSTHNIQCIPDFIRIKLRWNLYAFARSVIKHRQFIKKNRLQFQSALSSDHIVIYDNVYDFGVNIYYVRPAYQVQKLKEAGFSNIRIFDLKSGKELKTEKEITANTDYWLYYLCNS